VSPADVESARKAAQTVIEQGGSGYERILADAVLLLLLERTEAAIEAAELAERVCRADRSHVPSLAEWAVGHS
jgi:hypothetical protein